MREIIIISADSKEVSKEFLNKLAQAIATETGTTDDKIIIHQWGTDEGEPTVTPTIDDVIRKAINILSPYVSTDTKTTENNLCFALLTNYGDEHKVLMNAIKMIALYSNPARLPILGIREYGVRACKSVYSKLS